MIPREACRNKGKTSRRVEVRRYRLMDGTGTTGKLCQWTPRVIVFSTMSTVIFPPETMVRPSVTLIYEGVQRTILKGGSICETKNNAIPKWTTFLESSLLSLSAILKNQRIKQLDKQIRFLSFPWRATWTMRLVYGKRRWARRHDPLWEPTSAVLYTPHSTFNIQHSTFNTQLLT